MRVFKILSPIVKLNSEGDTLKITGYASTSDTDRVGDVIVPDAWVKNGGLDNFKKNPIILFNHNYGKPIGRAVELEVDGTGLKITCEISASAGEVYGLIKDSVLSTFSVGFLIKNADYNEATDGYIIREAELLEVSVVSVPCNQEATFSISKSLNPEEFKQFKKEVLKEQPTEEEVNASNLGSPKTGAEAPPERKRMDEAELQALIQKAAADAIRMSEEARAEAAKKAADEEAANTALKTATETAAKVAAEAATKSVEEQLLSKFDEKLKENNDNWEKTFGEMKSELDAKADELKAMRDSKMQFSDRGNSTGDWTQNKQLVQLADDAFLLSKVCNLPLEKTKVYGELQEKFNTHSTVSVGTDRLETTVSTQIERDIWNELILAPLFREINMTSATMTVPIMPDAGYAEITSNPQPSGAQPNGNMDPRGAPYGAPYTGLTLSEQTLSTIKMIAKSYLGNETEEDAIIPILPLIREAMIRSHARGVENMLLAGNTTDGVYTTGAADGLLKFASTGGRTVTTAGVGTKLTAASLFGLRKLMGKYGLNPQDVVYIVSQQAYFELIEDAEFADADLVGNQATKLTGEVGRVYGSRILMCDEFATPAAGKYHALALNRRNFIIPRLRGVTVESEYQVEMQRRVLVTSQRLGFAEVIPGATSIVGLKYAAS